jgi:hypothetical protein
MLGQELEPLDEQIERVRQKREALEGELRVVEAELNAFSEDRQRFDALRHVCDALDTLGQLKGGSLFWEGIPEVGDAAAHTERVRSRIVRFEGEISGILEKQQSLQEQINRCLDELDILYEEVREAHEREERRKEEFVVEREASPMPYRPMVMPWNREGESERRFRRVLLVALLVCVVLGIPVSLINVAIPERTDTVVEIPKRLAQLVKKELPKPPPPPKPVKKEDPEEPEQAKKEPEPRTDEPKPDKKPQQPAPAPSEETVAREKAERVGVLKFKEAFADLMEETPVAQLGTEASLSNQDPRVKGQAVAQRSLVAMQAEGGTSGGIGGARVSRNIGNGNVNRLGGGAGTGAGFVRVESSIAGLAESARPTTDGLPPGRTDEEIQIVFDRYKAALYRIYNKELRKDPTLRGKILMRISIEPSGEVSLCEVESTDLGSPELVAKIVRRVKQFNFGPKEDVQRITILYPIDFLPAG